MIAHYGSIMHHRRITSRDESASIYCRAHFYDVGESLFRGRLKLFFFCPNLRVQKRQVRPFWRGSGRKFNRVESRTSHQPSYDINRPRIYPPVCPFSVCYERLFTEKFRQFLFPFISFILCWTLSLSFYFVTPSAFILKKGRCSILRWRCSKAFWNNSKTIIILLVFFIIKHIILLIIKCIIVHMLLH